MMKLFNRRHIILSLVLVCGMLAVAASAGAQSGEPALAQNSEIVAEPVVQNADVAVAAVADPFTVAGVEVDATAKNAVEAREKAFAEAQVKAFTQLAERLMPEDQRAGFKAPDAATISTMINDFEVTQERLSAVRYVGTYTFRFNADYVRQYLNVQGVSYTEIASKPVLVLPFFQVGASQVLWRDNNPWLQAWNRLDQTGGLVPVAVPLGDVRDVASIGDNEALTYQPAGLADMLDRYGANEAVIVMASQSTGAQGLDVLIYRTDRSQPEYVQTLNIPAGADGNALSDAVFDQAVQAVRQTLQKEWKAQTAVAVTADPQNVLSARVPFTTMQQWVETRNALKRVQGIADMRILSVTPREARVEFVFQGGEDRLRLALSQADLILSQPSVVTYDPTYGDMAMPQTYDLMLKKYGSPY